MPGARALALLAALSGACGAPSLSCGADLCFASGLSSGAVPATIAVMGGRIHVGLTAAELDMLGQARDVMKLSRADLAACLALGRTGATTVAATMICARQQRIDLRLEFDLSRLHALAAHGLVLARVGSKLGAVDGDRALEAPVHGVELQHVRQVIRLEQIVDGNDLNVVEVLNGSTKHHASDATESVDTYFDGHGYSFYQYKLNKIALSGSA
jgi:hypothetical protein